VDKLAGKKRGAIYDTIIVGGGIAGITAAIYAARKRMRFELIANELGGQFMVSGEVLNYPGFKKTTGFELAERMQDQLEFNSVKPKQESVSRVSRKGKNFLVSTDKDSYETRTVIIATGARPRKLNVPGEDRLANKGVAYCSICDGPLFAKKKVAIIGGGNAALEAVDFIRDIASRIYIIVLDSKFSGHEYLIENVKKNPKVTVIFNAKTTEIVGDRFVKGLKYVQGGKEKSIDVEGVIIEIGRVPNTEMFRDVVKIDPDGHILIDCTTSTSTAGIFAAGDCASGHEYQYVIAAGQGCMALLKAARYLANLRS
jgi:thioredoxin-disulfide reductase